MKFTLYTSAKHFSDDVLEALNRHEIQNNLIYKNIGDGKFMASVKDGDGKVVLTAARTAPFPMMMYEADNIRNDDAVQFFARSLIENGIDVDTVLTEKELAKSFSEHYGRFSNKKYQYDNKSLVLYVLEELNDMPPTKDSLRKATAADMFYLPYWYADFAPACNIGEYNLSEGIEAATNSAKAGTSYIWTDNHPVSVAANVRNMSNCAYISRVYTPPNLRGKGYSTACVWHLSRKLMDDGFKYCALFADTANPSSNKVYQKVGYKEIFRYDRYKLVSAE